ncbi:CIC11C00000001362 [Sungouiella intermedia]|uniref:CIC11C00000001362 n=1 Tax=Sungouiella intermedia TaxID=45354 RepID=A0A1L0DEK3_9ASCO|nr:CIC11C00000001362 [[Candida] intermedia]
MSIKSINTHDVAKITSGQVIIDLVSVVKELVENAIDAGSSKIEITFNNYGTISVEVADNGRGIEAEDFASLALKHHTSKLTTFEDLALVSTLGFRGEAMSSLCSVASVKLLTCTSSSFPRSTELHFDTLGNLTSQKTAVSGKKGTTVTISDLFRGMPVREKNFIKNSKREYSRALTMLMAYLLTYTNIRFTVFNVSGSTGKKTMAMGTQGGKASTIDALVSVFGSNGAYGLIPIDIKSTNIDARFKLNMHSVPMSLGIRLFGFISDTSFGLGRGSGDRQFLTVNKRPVIHKRIAKVINEVYKAFNATQVPVFVLEIELDTAFVDVNVTPDKRMVLMQSEDVVVEVLREELCSFFEGRDNFVPKSALGAVSIGRKAAASKQELTAMNNESGLDEVLETNEKESGDETKEKEKEKDSTEVTASLEGNSEDSEETALGVFGENYESFEVINGKETESQKAEDDESDVGQENPSEDQNRNANHHVVSLDSQDPSLKQGTDLLQRRSSRTINEVNTNLHLVDPPVESVSIESHPEHGQIRCKIANGAPLLQHSTDGWTDSRAHCAISTPDEVIDHTMFTDDVGANCASDEVDKFDDLQETAIYELFVPEVTEEDVNHLNGANDPRRAVSLTQSSQRVSKHNARQTLHDVDAAIGSHPVDAGRANRSRGACTELVYQQRSHLALKIPRENFPPHHDSKSGLQLEYNESYSEKQKSYSGVRAAFHDLTQALEIKKSDFGRMQVVGQFNLGFIIVVHLGKLFIVDQHALDEIFNYERLMRSLVLRAQPLVVPRTLELSAVDEMVVLEHMTQLRKNGFIVEEDADAPPGHRVKLIAVPVLKNVVFDDSDLHELVHKLHHHGISASQTSSQRLRQTVRCTKVDGMIALRACRLSIMVGQLLGKSTMSIVVKHLSTLDRPWNCPHGRPTMRHLVDLEGDLFGEDYEV